MSNTDTGGENGTSWWVPVATDVLSFQGYGTGVLWKDAVMHERLLFIPHAEAMIHHMTHHGVCRLK